MKALTGVKVYLSEEDANFMNLYPEEILGLNKDCHPQAFTIDEYYSDEQSVVLGNTAIRTLLTPGHTIGCTSFFRETVNPVNGDTYTADMHDGVGTNTMSDKYYSISKYLTPALRQRFLDDSEKYKIHPRGYRPSKPSQPDRNS